jgi:hypothetical protein
LVAVWAEAGVLTLGLLGALDHPPADVAGRDHPSGQRFQLRGGRTGGPRRATAVLAGSPIIRLRLDCADACDATSRDNYESIAEVVALLLSRARHVSLPARRVDQLAVRTMVLPNVGLPVASPSTHAAFLLTGCAGISRTRPGRATASRPRNST